MKSRRRIVARALSFRRRGDSLNWFVRFDFNDKTSVCWPLPGGFDFWVGQRPEPGMSPQQLRQVVGEITRQPDDDGNLRWVYKKADSGDGNGSEYTELPATTAADLDAKIAAVGAAIDAALTVEFAVMEQCG